MELTETLETLEEMGTEQNRKVYRRHGVGGKFYGVSFANLEALRKRIKTDHTLAQQLWETGNHDARVLATMIADPKQLGQAQIDAWAGSLENHIQTDALAKLLNRTSLAPQLVELWVDSPDEWKGRLGWHLLAQLAMSDNALPDSYFEPYLAQIEAEIHTRKNRTREGMNYALMAIGIRNDTLEVQAVATAQRIGKVEIDHGDTNCKTPDAIPYIQKARARQAKRVATR
jgi:3-methyladenine DNA glycosylase AlkD